MHTLILSCMQERPGFKAMISSGRMKFSVVKKSYPFLNITNGKAKKNS